MVIGFFRLKVFCLVNVLGNIEKNVAWNVLRRLCVLMMVCREGGKELSEFGWVKRKEWGIGW